MSHHEPSMEDILASIRKMISEEPSEQRPMPDQMGRAPFGEAPEPTSNVWGAQPAAPVEAPVSPSFSSLSEALNSSAPAGEQRSFEERISGLVEDEGNPGNDGAASAPHATSDPLLRFSPNGAQAPGPQAGLAQTPRAHAPAAQPVEPQRHGLARPSAPEPGPLSSAGKEAETPSANKFSDLGSAIPERHDALSSSRPDAGTRNPDPFGSAPPPKKDAPLPFGAKPEEQRVISIGSRPQNAGAPGLNGSAPPASEAKNGSPANGAASNGMSAPSRPASLSPTTRSLQERLRESSSAGLSKTEGKSGIDVAARLGSAKAETKPEPTSAPSTTIGSPVQAKTEDKSGGAAAGDPAAGPATKPSVTKPGTEAGATAAAPGMAGSGPSEALLDAVVDLVQKDPGSMSVFTSGSAFIHGVGDKPGEPLPAELVPVPGQKLDNAAAQLLRPMLRQWLAENMPRIVEEALRSELTSGQEAEKDPKKS